MKAPAEKDEIALKIRSYALQNALKFNGTAQPGAIIGKLLKDDPLLKDRMKELGKQIAKIVKEVNALSLDEQKRELERLAPELLERKKPKKKELHELPNAERGKVVTRIPPEPSKYNHIGHALSFLLNYLYAKKYEGRCILRFEDTNPGTAKQEYVDAMQEDVLDYLGIKPDKTVFVSDDMPRFYELAEQLIKRNKAYVCCCERETMQELRHQGTPCPCRKASPEDNRAAWQKMLARGFKEGEAVLRLALDMQAENQVMRDPVIFRISYEPHYRQKENYCVWPMYDFENAVEEEFCGVTHIMRSAEFGEMRVELQEYIKDLFGFRKQEVIQYGRFNVVGAITQGREIRKLIEEKKVIGWDDPRLVTLRALKRRGITRQMFYDLALEVGLSKTQTNIDWSMIAAINRRILDPVANRYFFIQKPKEIAISGAPARYTEIKLHPDHPERGVRKLRTGTAFFIEEKDLRELKDGELCRLMHAFNFVKKKKEFIFDSDDLEKYRTEGKKIIHWLPKDEKLAKVAVMMPDATIIEGLAEPAVRNIGLGEVVQFERFGFCRLDAVEKEQLVFWFTHE